MGSFLIMPRMLYKEKMFRALGNDNLMIVTGVRRSGKSCIAERLEAELYRQFQDDVQIVRFNFEKINSARISADYLIGEYRTKRIEGKRCYILLDEITRVVDWERAVNEICAKPACKMILFSSNRRVISKNLTAVQENRYDVIQVFPLSLPEFIYFQNFREITALDTPICEKRFVRFDERTYTVGDIYQFYITYGGLPILKPEYMDEERAWVIADGSYAAVVTRDILEQGSANGTKAITDPLLLRTIIMILAESIGDNISATWIGKRAAEYLHRPCATKTVESYLSAILNAHLFYVAERYDIREERFLQSMAKYYIVDAGLHNYITGVRAEDENRLLENKVFFELLRRGYQVCNGKRWQDEICLVASRNEEKAYIQVGEKNGDGGFEHLIAPLIRIPNNYPKIVITFDSESKISGDGTIMLNALDFLMGRSW